MLETVRQEFNNTKVTALYLSLFEKRIHPKYLQNLLMVLNIFCNDDKMCRNKLPEIFRYKCIPNLYCLIQFLLAKEPSGLLGKLSSFSASYQLFIVLLNIHLVFCEDQKQTLKVPWFRIASIIWHYYPLNVLLSTDQILKK